MALPLVELTGSPYEQGRQHGAALRERIKHNLAIYFDRFARELGLSRAEVLARATRYAEAIARQCPAYDAAMRGVAEGSDLAFAAIAALNVRYELFYHQLGVIARGDGCTAFALLPGANAEGHLLLGENWDWLAGVQGVVLHTIDDDGLETLSFSEAGIVGGKIGLNNAGLGLAINGLHSDRDDWARLQTPFHVRCYQILRVRTLEDAAQIIGDEPRSCSANYLIAQTPDRVLNLETAPDTLRASGCAAGLLVHANHFVDPAALAIREPIVDKYPHSAWRHARLAALLAARPLRLADLMAALRDHQHHPYSICFHIDPTEPPEEHYETRASAIIDLTQRALYLSDGPPCQNEYLRFILEG